MSCQFLLEEALSLFFMWYFLLTEQRIVHAAVDLLRRHHVCNIKYIISMLNGRT